MKILKLLGGLTSIIIIGVVVYYQFIFTYLPSNLDFDQFKDRKKYTEDEVVFKNESKNELIVVIPVYGHMAYSSNYNIIGLYRNKKLVDEFKIGSIPIQLRSWNEKEIAFEVIAERDKLYLDSWSDKNHYLGKYKCKFVYPI